MNGSSRNEGNENHVHTRTFLEYFQISRDFSTASILCTTNHEEDIVLYRCGVDCCSNRFPIFDHFPHHERGNCENRGNEGNV